MPITKSSKLALERWGMIPTHRGPLPRMTPGDINILDAELARPLPLAEFVSNGVPPPDRSSTAAPDPWPHGP
jgi:hypothetical protein